MARGWESKSVEEQISSSQEPKAPDRPRLLATELAKARQKQSLLLARAQTQRSLELAPHPRRREMLQQALADLDARLWKIETSG